MPVPASLLPPPPSQPLRALTREDFEVLSLCGSGEYGRVLMVRCLFNSQIYAMKVRDRAWTRQGWVRDASAASSRQ
jgi:hypothetical protein